MYADKSQRWHLGRERWVAPSQGLFDPERYRVEPIVDRAKGYTWCEAFEAIDDAWDKAHGY